MKNSLFYKRYGVSALCLVTMTSLSGCGDSSSPDTTRTTTPQAPTTTTTTTGACAPRCVNCVGGNCTKCEADYSVDDQGACVAACVGKAPPAPPAVPSEPQQYNGVAWPDMCIDKSQARFFGIGDWGGINDGGRAHVWQNPGRPNYGGSDNWGQLYVARQMKALAPSADPDYILNVGDNFYPGGYSTQCGQGQHDPSTGQWDWGFKEVYSGEGMDGKPWLSVLGNHDYGGIGYHSGWDAQIFRTWAVTDGTWRLPAQFWSQRVQYKDFAVQYFFLDSNTIDAHPAGEDMHHNICQGADDGCYDIPGPNNGCSGFFKQLMDDGVQMIRDVLSNKTADYHIIVTHFPDTTITQYAGVPELHNDFGIDLVLSGHRHQQEFGYDDKTGISWIVSGGGGGVSSDGSRDGKTGNDDAYGFVDFEINRTQLTVNMMSWGGCTGPCDGTEPFEAQKLRSSHVIKPHRKSKGAEFTVSYV